MDDLISRAAALAEVEQWAEHGYDVIHWTGIKAMLETQPAVDAAPVVHARWIQHEPDLHGTKPLECGACHYLFARLYPRDFCSHCGAKMDGGANDAEQ